MECLRYVRKVGLKKRVLGLMFCERDIKYMKCVQND